MKTLIISLGHRYRSDDAVGPYTIDLLKPVLSRHCDFVESVGDTSALLDIWQARETVILIDACYDENTSAGQILKLDGLTQALPLDKPVASNHALSINNAIELGKLMNALPHSLTIYSIAGKDFSMGEELTPDVVAAAKQVAALIVNTTIPRV